MKRHHLKRLTIRELSLVDRGANQGALHVLRKRAQAVLASFLKAINPEDNPSDEMVEMSGALAVSLEDIVAKSETPEELEANLTETLDQLKAAVIAKACAADGEMEMPAPKKKKAGTVQDDASGDDGDAEKRLRKNTPTEGNMDRTTVLKGLSPEGVAYIESLEKKLDTATDAAAGALKIAKAAQDSLADQHLRSVAEDLTDGTLTSVEEAVSLLKLAGDDKEKLKSVETMLKRQQEVVQKSGLLTEYGADDSESPNATDELQRLAEERVSKSAGKLTFQKAYSQVIKENPELYEAILNGDDIEAVEPVA